jgi:hypothetical protein
MNAELWYLLANLIPLPWWGLMILAPQAKLTRRITGHYGIFLFLALLYVVFLALGIWQWPGQIGFGYDEVRQFLSQSSLGFLAAWIHYLVFDLFVGFWIYEEGQRLKLPVWQTSGCLFFTLMFGPLGLGLFLMRRWLHRLNLSQA